MMMETESRELCADKSALQALIQRAVKQVRQRGGADTADSLVFMGNWHQAIPALVVQDPVLEPVDKLVWMVIQLQAQQTGGRTAFPRYDTIARTANIGSTTTVSRAIAILRITRWLTLCARVRNAQGQFRGNVYALHDEPLALHETLQLDADYMAYINHATGHHHARVCRVAQAVLLSMDEGINGGGNLTQSEPVLERRVQTARFSNQTQPKGYFAFTGNALKQLNNRKGEAGNHQDQNLKAVDGGLLSSCCDLNNTTTTELTTENSPVQADIRALSAALIFPARLSVNQRLLAARYLLPVDSELHQPVLDELQGRLAAEKHGMAPLYDPLRFLYALCQAAKRGEFMANLGIAVKDARIAQQKSRSANQRQLSLLEASSPVAKSPVTPQAEEQLRLLRQSLGLSTGIHRSTDVKPENPGC